MIFLYLIFSSLFFLVEYEDILHKLITILFEIFFRTLNSCPERYCRGMGWNGSPARRGERPARRSRCAGNAPFGGRAGRAEARRQVAAEYGQVGRATRIRLHGSG